MSDDTRRDGPESSVTPDKVRGRLAEELREALVRGETPKLSLYAKKYGLSVAEVAKVLAGVKAMASAFAAKTDAVASGATSSGPPPLPADYEVLGELGRGAMGVVYRARQRSMDRVVAVKVLRPGDALFVNLADRFRREVKALAKLRHPHIVAVHEVGEAGGHLFFAMDLVEGGSLHDLIGRGEVTPTRAVKLMTQVASAIAYTHSHGLVHRDLKPGNILVDRSDDAFVVDFGLARDLAVKGDLTGTGQILGTPAYMSPEQAKGDAAAIGEASDVYAMGAVLYECLTGRAPFAGKSLVDMIRAVVEDEPTAPRKIDARIPRDLEVICQTAMAKAPQRRYPSAQAFQEDLERFVEGLPIRARPASAPERLRRWAQRNPALASSVAGAFVFLVVGLAVTSWLLAETTRQRNEKDAALVDRDKALAAERASSAVADDRRRLAEAAERRADGQRLLAQSSSVLSSDPGLALLLAIEGAGRAPGCLADDALRHALDRHREIRVFRDEVRVLRDEPQVYRASDTLGFAESGNRLLRISRGVVHAFDVGSGDDLGQWRISRSQDAILGEVSLFDVRGGPRQIVVAEVLGDAVAGEADPAWRVFDAADGREMTALTALKDADRGRAIGMSRDGAFFASTHAVWSTADGRPRVQFDAEFRGGAFSLDGAGFLEQEKAPEGSYAFSVFDLRTGACVGRVEGKGAVVGFAYLAEGPRVFVAAGAGGPVARMFDAASGRDLGVVPNGLTAPIADGPRLDDVRIDARGKQWTFVAGDRAFLWSPGDSGVRVLAGGASQSYYWRFSPDGRLLAGFPADPAQTGRAPRVWTCDSGAAVADLVGHVAEIECLKWSPDGSLLETVSSQDRSVRVWGVTRPRAVATVGEHGQTCDEVRFLPDDGRILVSGWLGSSWAGSGTDPLSRPVLWDAGTGLPLPVPAGRIAAASPDGVVVAVAGFGRPDAVDRDVLLCSVSDGAVIGRLVGHEGPIVSMAFRPDGRRIATASSDGTIRIWDAATRTQLRALSRPGVTPRRLAYAADGLRVVTVNNVPNSASVLIDWDPESGAAVWQKSMQGTWFTESPDGARVAFADMAGDTGQVTIVDAAGGASRVELQGHEDWVYCAAFSPDGAVVATGSMDRTARIWDARSGQERRRFDLPDRVYGVAFSADGSRVLASTLTGEAWIWDVADGRPIATISGASGPRLANGYESVARWRGLATFSHDGAFVAVVSEESGIRVSPIDPLPHALAARSRGLTPRERLDYVLAPPPDVLQKAVSLVAGMHKDGLLREEIEQSLGDAKDVGTDVREAALACAGEIEDESWRFDGRARRVVADRAAGPGRYRQALRWARTARELLTMILFVDQDDALGGALYRTGDYASAERTLSDNSRCAGSTITTRTPFNLAFLAMSQWKLGRAEEARATLALLREAMKTEENAKSDESQALLREAQTLIGK